MVVYHFNHLWHETGLFPSHFITGVSLAYQSFLYNGKDPKDCRKPIFLELPEEKIDNMFSGKNQGVNGYQGC